VEASELEIVRRAYAMQVMAAAGVEDARVETAFGAVEREDFLGRGPWPVLRWRSPTPHYARTPSADPVYLYINGVIGILPERAI
jgi:protein-L-isoaspartate(D-aspartate) O-methyltransferase